MQSPFPSDDIRAALAAHLEAARHEIVAEWMNAVRADPLIPSTDHLTLSALQDHFPEMLAELIAALRLPKAGVDTPQTRQTGQQHGQARWRYGYRIDEVLREVARVRDIVLARATTFARDNQGDGDNAADIIRRFFDTIAATSAQQFLQEQQAEVLLRSRQLHHAYEQVQAATEQLRTVADSRLRLLRGVSHELRNALHILGLTAQTLLDGTDTEDRSAIAERLGSSATRLQQLLDRLQDFSEILAGEVHLKLERIALPALFAELEERHRPSAQRKNVELECTVPSLFPIVVIDRAKLRAIADILLANAILYTARGFVHARALADGPTRWILRVEDTGAGISPESVPHIFSEFHRRSGQEHHGVGLGLVIARHLANLMDGEITFRPQAGGGGTVFDLHLPNIVPDT